MRDSDQHERLHRLVLSVPLIWVVWVNAIGFLFYLLDTGRQSASYYYVLNVILEVPALAVFAAALVLLLSGRQANKLWRTVLLGGTALMIFYVLEWILRDLAWVGAPISWLVWIWVSPSHQVMLAAYVTLLALWQMRLSRAQSGRE
jgi:hypothetical protein